MAARSRVCVRVRVGAGGGGGRAHAPGGADVGAGGRAVDEGGARDAEEPAADSDRVGSAVRATPRNQPPPSPARLSRAPARTPRQAMVRSGHASARAGAPAFALYRCDGRSVLGKEPSRPVGRGGSSNLPGLGMIST